MAHVEKYTMNPTQISQIFRHNNREILNPSNTDIDPSRSDQNYSLLPGRDISDYDYFISRKEELYCYGRDDVKVLAGWVVSAPEGFSSRPIEDTRHFFETVHDFMCERYGKKNIIQSVVHADEAGMVPHCHVMFIPVAQDQKHSQGEKICAGEVLSRKEMRNFHPALQKYMDTNGPEGAVVYKGGTSLADGRNRSVDELKRTQPIDRDRTDVDRLRQEVQDLRGEVAELKREIARDRSDPGDGRDSRGANRTVKIRI